MTRRTLRIPDAQEADVQDLVDDGVFPNQSEAIRHAIRELIADYHPRPRARPDGGTTTRSGSRSRTTARAERAVENVTARTSEAAAAKQRALEALDDLEAAQTQPGGRSDE